MKLAVATPLALIVALLGLIFTAYAAASTQTASDTAGYERAYRIDIALDNAELRVRPAALASDESRVEARITPCLTKAFIPIFEAVDSKSNPSSNRALKSLSGEAGAEYVIAAIRPVLTPLLNAVSEIVKLHVPAVRHSKLKTLLSAFAKVQSLNVCADARAWFAAGLAPAKEPKGTAQTTVALTTIAGLTSSAEKPQGGDLTPAQLQNVKLDGKRAGRHTNDLIKQSDTALKSWIVKLIRSVEVKVEATQTSTTG
jgi:hypothetical protein